MGWLGPLASLAGMEVDDLVARLRRNAVAWGAIGALGLVSVVFLLVALDRALVPLLGPVVAPVVIAGGSLIIALIIYAAMHFAEAAAARREAERRKTIERTALATTAVLTALPSAMKIKLVRRLGIPLGGAIAAAYLMARERDAQDAGSDVRDGDDG